jgi:hypothetical protein
VVRAAQKRARPRCVGGGSGRSRSGHPISFSSMLWNLFQIADRPTRLPVEFSPRRLKNLIHRFLRQRPFGCIDRDVVIDRQANDALPNDHVRIKVSPSCCIAPLRPALRTKRSGLLHYRHCFVDFADVRRRSSGSRQMIFMFTRPRFGSISNKKFCLAQTTISFWPFRSDRTTELRNGV